ncbi:MAG: DUF4139 domain-containing protein [Planctomycetes bacterium]|nr:DUF4139 domain-containing protein [Planctomycetota bacterium]
MPDTLACESRISRVVVYARGAVVTREVELPVSVPPEGVTLELRGITSLAEPASFRTSVDGERIVTSLRAPLIAPVTPPPPTPDEALVSKLQREISRLNELTQRKQRQRDAVAAMSIDADLKAPKETESDGAGGAGGIEKRVGDVLAISALQHEILTALDAELDALAEKVRAKGTELKAARNPARAAAGTQYSRSAQVTLAPGSAQLRKLEVSYTVRPARWWPAYSARLEGGGKHAHFALEAFVAQVSGENWTGARIALCTADMLTDVTLPELASLRLGRRQPPRRTGFRAPPEGLDALFAGYDSFVTPPQIPMPAIAEPSPRDYGEDMDDMVVGSVSAMPEEEWQQAPTMSAPAAPASGFGGAADMRMEAKAMPRQSAPAKSAKKGRGDASRDRLKDAGVERSRSLKRSVEMESADEAGGAALDEDYEGADGVEEDFADEGADAESWLDFDTLEVTPGEVYGRGRLARGSVASAPGLHQALNHLEGLAGPGGSSDPRYSRGMFDHQFEAEDLVEIPADGTAHRIRLLSRPAKSRMRMRCVPLADERVFREVELENPLEAPLLPGPVDVFMDGALLITAQVGSVDRGGTVRFGLGEEQRVTVARNMRASEETKGLLGGKASVAHVVTLEVASSLPAEIELELIERVPVAAGKDIHIEVNSSTPKAELYKQEERDYPVKGGYRWLLKLPAGGKQEVKLQYTLAFDKDYEVEGGNRRA